MEENKIPQFHKTSSINREIHLITSVISEDNKEYFLYSDGNLYEKNSEGKLIKLNNVRPESQQLIKKIMQNFKAGKTDIYEPGNNSPITDKKIEVDLPEL